MKEQLALLPDYLGAHLGLSLAALMLGILVSIPLGVLVSRYKYLEPPIIGAAGVLQTVPSLALLAFMVPALAALGAQSIGYLPALIGLFLYSLLPILRNTVTGLHGLDPAVIEAAQGVGMTPRESLTRVELPLAMPVIIAGIRTSAVWTVGTATLSTPVGAPSLGNYIFGGLQTRNYTLVLIGCVASAILALFIDGCIRALALGVERRSRRLTALGLATLTLLSGASLTHVVKALRGGGETAITIGAKPFTESYILGDLLAEQARRGSGVSARVLGSLGSTVLFDALVAGEIDAYVDYSGTLYVGVLGHGEPRPDRATLLAQITRELDQKHGVTAIALGFENTYALAMPQATADRLGVRRLSDLTLHAPKLRFGGDYEFFHNPEWKSITRIYGLSVAEQRDMDPSLMYDAARTGQIDVISAYSTDGRIDAFNLAVLEDDRGAIPPYDAVILVSKRLRQQHPAVFESLQRLGGRIDAATMRGLNRRVDQGGETAGTVARAFLDSSTGLSR